MKNHVFYAEDDTDDIFMFTKALKDVSTDFDLVTVESGEELLDRLSDPPPTPNIIFLDLNMPGKDGRQTLKEIKQNQSFKKFPVVIFSTSSSEEDIKYSHNNGASLFVTKPTEYSKLKQVIKDCLNIDWTHFTQPSYDKFYLS